MGLFKYIVSGNASGCREFFESLDHCYYKDIEFEEGTADDHVMWISGQRKMSPKTSQMMSESISILISTAGIELHHHRLLY